jgi:hypothetical protein
MHPRARLCTIQHVQLLNSGAQVEGQNERMLIKETVKNSHIEILQIFDPNFLY